ncbi:MAG: DUF839 domain-containing protein, partial [Candidatus Poribacteria bacterium]|nr:DUF839 domain-containing protein [Candidatus Poribacteria bacterium]
TFSTTGETMDDGFLVPGGHDGMAAFPGPDGKTILVRNHELEIDARTGAFGQSNELVNRIDSKRIHDFGQGSSPALGGTTTLIYNTRTKKLEKQFLSLAGTMRNCAGGPTPWNTWISCEECVQRAEDTFETDHGYNFEVPVSARGIVTPTPLKAMGRFYHEAVAVDARTGIVYQTEDRGDGLLYRFIPHYPGKLMEGGRLQALRIRDLKSADTRNWKNPLETLFPLVHHVVPVGETLDAEWIDIENVESPKDDLRNQGFHDKGAARFARGEGMWYSDGVIFFACTNGGERRKGQIWKYTPSPFEGTHDEEKKPGVLELFVESKSSDLLENADNLTVAPWGDLIVCEDGLTEQFLVGITPEGRLYRFARNAKNVFEFAGSTFSPDGSTLFVNIQTPGITLAITGPWKTVASDIEQGHS